VHGTLFCGLHKFSYTGPELPKLGILALQYWPRFELNYRETRVRKSTTCLIHDTRTVLTATLLCFRTTFPTAADTAIPPKEGLLYIPHNPSVPLRMTVINHYVVCLETDPQFFPKRFLHRLRSSVSSFNYEYLLASFVSWNSCLQFLIRLPVISILLYIFSSTTCFRRQFLC
jgi:hypothetical protein